MLPGPVVPAQTASLPVNLACPAAASAAPSSCRTPIHSILSISQFLLHVPPAQYLDRVHAAVDVKDLFVGLVKAPVFALIIAAIGCMHGLRVKGSAESVGRETTKAVVKAIFLVIVLDALFSILFEKLGL